MRPIKTYYFDMKGNPIHVNSGSDANRAVAQAILHMQINHYGARTAQVVDSATGELHAEIVRKTGTAVIEITYKRDPSNFERKYNVGLWLNGTVTSPGTTKV